MRDQLKTMIDLKKKMIDLTKKKSKKGIPTYEEHHRELVRSAVKNKRLCPTCKSDGCRLKCTKCKAVAYCDRECQIADWPKHKVICREFQHVINVYKSMAEETREGNIVNAYEFVYVSFTLANIEAEVTHSFVTMKGASCGMTVGMRRPVSVVLVEGRIYDITAHVPNMIYPASLHHEYGPLPPDSAIAENPAFTKYVNQMKTYHGFPDPEIPCMCSTFEKDKAFLKNAHRLKCRVLMATHYIDYNDREAIIRMYGAEKIKKASGQSVKGFRAYLDRIIMNGESEDVALSILSDEYNKFSSKRK